MFTTNAKIGLTGLNVDMSTYVKIKMALNSLFVLMCC